MKIGASYYPEILEPAEWERDLTTARELGLSALRCGEFTWSAFSPEPDRWEPEWARRFLELAHRLGFSIVWCTPSATPPPYLFDRWPDLPAVTIDGDITPVGIRRHYCPSHAGYRAAAAEMAERVAKAIGDLPAIVGWQVDNEIAGDGFACWCPRCGEAFQSWLRERYGSLDELNRVWQTQLWSQVYTRWEQIPVPAKPFWNHAPALHLAFRRFRSDNWLRFYAAQAEAIHRQSHKPVTTNFYNYTWDLPFDQWHWRETMQVIGASHYIEEENASRFQLALLSGTDAKPLWVLEQKAGQQRAQNLLPDDLSRIERHLRLCAENGVEIASYWHLRQHSAGCEMEHGAVLRHDGRPTRIAQTIQKAIAATSGVQRSIPREDVLLVFDFGQHWAQEQRPAAGEKWAYADEVESCWFAGTRAACGSLRIGSVADLDTASGMILLPFAQMLLPGLHEAVLAALHRGATVVTTADYGRLDPENSVLRERPLASWEETFPVPELEMFHLDTANGVSGEFEQTPVCGRKFWFAPLDGAIVTGRGHLSGADTEGPMLLDQTVGRGRLLIFLTSPDQNSLAAVLRNCLKE